MHTPQEALRRARWQFVGSYIHKIVIAGVAVAAFSTLMWLGDQGSQYAAAKNRSEWSLSHDTVQLIVQEANTIVNTAAIEHPPSESTAQQDVRAEALADAADVIQAVGLGLRRREQRTLGSREEWIAALEEQVDAHIWGLGTGNLERRRKASQSATDRNASQDLERIVRQEQAWVQARIAASHALIRAASPHAAPKIKPPAEEGSASSNDLATGDTETPRWQTMFDSKHPRYVIFQMLWYTLLLLAVMSISYLLLILFAAIPGTPAESYWTKKITEILGGSAPGFAAKAITPLLGSALLAGAVLAPTTYATAPGGLSREGAAELQSSMHPGVTVSDTDIEATTVNTSVTFNEEYRSLMRFRWIQIDGLDEETFGLRIEALEKELKREIPAGVEGALAPDLAAVRRGIAGVSGQVAQVSADQRVIAGEVQLIHDDTGTIRPWADSTNRNVGTVLARQGELDGAIGRAKSAITATQTEQDALITNDRVQFVEADRRGFFLRTFGLTLFHVGPAVADGMARTLDPKGECSLPDTAPMPACARVLAIQAMTDEPPADRWEFEARLRDQLTGRKLDQSQIDTIVDEELGRLLRVSALRRF